MNFDIFSIFNPDWWMNENPTPPPKQTTVF